MSVFVLISTLVTLGIVSFLVYHVQEYEKYKHNINYALGSQEEELVKQGTFSKANVAVLKSEDNTIKQNISDIDRKIIDNAAIAKREYAQITTNLNDNVALLNSLISNTSSKLQSEASKSVADLKADTSRHYLSKIDFKSGVILADQQQTKLLNVHGPMAVAGNADIKGELRTSNIRLVDTKNANKWHVTSGNGEFKLAGHADNANRVRIDNGGTLHLQEIGGITRVNNVTLPNNGTNWQHRSGGDAAIVNANDAQALMIVGRESGGRRRVSVWDELNVHGALNVNGTVNVEKGGNNTMTYYGGSSTYPTASLYVGSGTDKTANNRAQVIATNGNLHLDSGRNNDMYLNHYSAGRPVHVNGPLNVNGAVNVQKGGDTTMTQYGGSSTWPNARLHVGSGTDKTANNQSQVIVTDGNLHLDSGKNNNLYLNHYTKRPVIGNNVTLPNNGTNWQHRSGGDAAIVNANDYNTLMIVGRGANGPRRVSVWDELNVHGQLDVHHNMRVSRHVDAMHGWANDNGSSVFLGWHNGKTVLGNGHTGGHDYAAHTSGPHNVVVTNPLRVHKQICIGNTCINEDQLGRIVKSAG
jgi:hypothetical protein